MKTGFVVGKNNVVTFKAKGSSTFRKIAYALSGHWRDTAFETRGSSPYWLCVDGDWGNCVSPDIDSDVTVSSLKIHDGSVVILGRR